jgi:hypothetical protein
MSVVVLPQTKLSEIQDIFKEKFPFLKIEFFKNENKKSVGPLRDQLVNPEKTVGEISVNKVGVTILFEVGTQVSHLEKDFKEKLGLFVQVFRRSGNVWLQTTRTVEWTLGDQNEHGREMSQVQRLKKEIE